MMSVWSHRPHFLHLGLFFAAYVLGCGFAQSLAIVPGTGISIWPPGGLFIATLIITPKRSWPSWVLAGCLAELFSNVLWFHSPLPAALLIYAGNALGAAVGAWLVNRVCRPPVRLETLEEVLAFVVLAAGIAPVVSATVGSATLAWFGMQSQTFTAAWPLWWIGDATGVLIVAPLALVALQNWRGDVQLSPARWMEACVVGLIFLGVAALSLSGFLPFAYIIMPPLLWAAVRFEFKGAAVALILLALITAVFTISGSSEFAGDPESQRQRNMILQLFLAISAFSALIVATLSRQHQLALLTVRKSERQLQQLIDAVPTLIWCTTPEGIPCYLNKRVTDVTGVTLKDLIAPDGSRSLSVVHPDDRVAMEAAFARAFETGASFEWRYRQRRAKGPHRWVESRAEPLRDESGAIVQWYGVSVDIEDMMRAQEALRYREHELSQLVDMVPSHVWRLRPDGEPTFFNRRMVDFLGLDVADADKPDMSRLEAVIETVVHPDDACQFRDALSHCLLTGENFAMRYRLRRADGIYRWMSSRAEPMRDQGGSIIQWYGICHDIDDQMRAEEALRQSEQRLQQMIDAVPVRIWSATPTGGPMYFNKRYQDHFRSVIANFETIEEPRIANLLSELVHPEDAADVQVTLKNCFDTGNGSAMRFRWREREGGYRWAECRVEPWRDESGAIMQWYGVSLDIDEEVRAQEALRDRERELSQLVDMVPVHIRRLTPEGEPIFFNKRLRDFFGLDVGDMDKPSTSRLAAIIQTLVHPDDATRLLERARHSFATGEPFSMKYRMRRADGEYRWVDGRGEPLRDQDGAIAQWYVISVDVDDEMRAQEALRESERSLWQLVETLPAMIDCAAPDGEPVYRNPQLRDFLGYQLEELDGRGKSRLDGTLDAGVHPDEVAGVKENYAHSLATGEPFARRHRLRRFDGEYRWVETRAAPMRNAEGTIVQWNVICLDIDGEVRAEEKLRLSQESLARASQAASLSELSASIAHEVNQPLAAVMANSHACQRWLMAAPPNIERAQRTVERIIRDASSAADVVSRIRALFKQSVDTRVHAAFAGVVGEARNLMAGEAERRRVRMDIKIDGDLPHVTIDRVQVQQVLVNLIRNGMEAMDSIADDRVLGMRARHIGDVIQTEISDCGPGIEFPERMFEPFFTTKEDGLGMGLAICRSIVELHGGRLWADKNEPHGATFIFTLPIEEKAAS
jgi:PAS domain S-box-containing protein